MEEAFKGSEIRLFLVNGEPDGVVRASIPLKGGLEVLAFSRTYFAEMSECEECQRVGVYVLIGKAPRREGEEKEYKVYIGLAAHLAKRIKEHYQGAESKWWHRAFIISCNREAFTKTHAEYFEHTLIVQARAAAQVVLTNKNTPKLFPLSEFDAGACEGLLSEAKILINTFLGTDIFTAAKVLQSEAGNTATPQSEVREPAPSLAGNAAAPGGTTVQTPDEGTMFEMYDSRGGIKVKAQARYIKGKWVVQKGSQGLMLEPGTKFSDNEKRRYESLCEKGILVESTEKSIMEFSKDCEFDTPRAATMVVRARYLGGGRDRWKLPEAGKPYAQWKTFGDWEQEQLVDEG